jgi:hypothetical protein
MKLVEHIARKKEIKNFNLKSLNYVNVLGDNIKLDLTEMVVGKDLFDSNGGML